MASARSQASPPAARPPRPQPGLPARSRPGSRAGGQPHGQPAVRYCRSRRPRAPMPEEAAMVTAIVLVKADVARIPETCEAIAQIPQVTEVYSVTGECDLVAMVRVRRHEELDDVIPGTTWRRRSRSATRRPGERPPRARQPTGNVQGVTLCTIECLESRSQDIGRTASGPPGAGLP